MGPVSSSVALEKEADRLLIEWLDSKDLTADDLCKEHPELQGEVQRRMLQKLLSWYSDSSTPVPSCPSDLAPEFERRVDALRQMDQRSTSTTNEVDESCDLSQ